MKGLKDFFEASEMPLELDIFHEGVDHIRQMYKWDCGIACLKMAISTSPEPCHLLWKRFDEAWLAIRSNESTNFGKRLVFVNLFKIYIFKLNSFLAVCRPWTIDFCNILNHLNIKFTYFTTSTEVSYTLSSLSFYSGTLTKVTFYT